MYVRRSALQKRKAHEDAIIQNRVVIRFALHPKEQSTKSYRSGYDMQFHVLFAFLGFCFGKLLFT